MSHLMIIIANVSKKGTLSHVIEELKILLRCKVNGAKRIVCKWVVDFTLTAQQKRFYLECDKTQRNNSKRFHL